IKSCLTLEEVQKEIKQYMTYYNHHRYQWNRKKMTPVQYRDHLLEVA
ncbi:IS3 family transposase, partial [Cytobacillus gottheilii]